jgi:hypothetical protein
MGSIQNITYSYTSWQQIFATPDVGVPLSRSYDASYIQYDGNNPPQKILDAGWFAGSIPSSVFVRPLPRAYLTTAVATSGTAVGVSPTNSQVFAVGDVLSVIAPYGVITFTGGWANGDVANLTVEGQTLTYTVAGFTSLNALAVTFAALINAYAPFRNILTAVASATTGAIYLYAANFLPKTIATSVTSTGTLPISGSITVLQANTSIGTIASINTTTGVITLSGNASIALPIGFPIGVAASNPTNLGMIGNPIDAVWDSNTNVGLYREASILANRLPYIDGELKRLFPSLQLVY